MKAVVRSKETTFNVECATDERLLYAALASGANLSYECASGTCGTCKARITSGEVEQHWPDAPALKKIKPERGEILLCQCSPKSDCEILVPGDLPKPTQYAPKSRQGMLKNVRALTHDVLAFTVVLEEPVAFEPGQFMVLQVPGLSGYRAYSMVNHEAHTAELQFVVKKFQGGGFSRFIFDPDLRDETRVTTFGPLGRATFRPAEGKDLLLLGGGSGIAGMMAILAHACDTHYIRDHRVEVFFGVRRAPDLFYSRELSKFKARAGANLDITVAFSDEDKVPEIGIQCPGIEFDTGFVHDVAIRRAGRSFDNVITYVAGPPPMVDGTLRALVTEAKLSPSFIRYDKFS